MKIYILADALTNWTEVGSVALVFTFIVAAITWYVTWTYAKKSDSTSNYTELDSMYFELLKVALEKPHLTNGASLSESKHKHEYNIYAFMMWNFLEAIYDRSQENDDLKTTWYPIIDTEHQLHHKWIEDDNNWHKFKEEFLRFIENKEFKTHCHTRQPKPHDKRKG